jgi:hypothetical protein
MLNWYIDSSKTEKKYLEVVQRNVQPCMDYFCNRLSEMEYYSDVDILTVFKEIVEELPFLTLKTKKIVIHTLMISGLNITVTHT